jgi:hypothetical protein
VLPIPKLGAQSSKVQKAPHFSALAEKVTPPRSLEALGIARA